MSNEPTPKTDAIRKRIPEPRAIQHMICLAFDLERELAAVTEQRNRLAEALKEIYNVSLFDYATMPEPARKKYRQVVLEIADDALQSLTPNEL